MQRAKATQKRCIGIIGGGPASVSLCLELKKQLNASGLEIEILVFEKNAHIGHGTPYALHEESHLLNLPKESMEPVTGESAYFVQWLKEQGLDTPTSFPARYLFGQYLEHRAVQAQLEAEPCDLTINYLVNNEVLDVETKGLGFQIKTTQDQYLVDFLVLSPGHMPSQNYQEWIGKDGYIHNPLSPDAFTAIDPNQSIILIGSRLTAIDAVLKLKRLGHRGKLTMASRSGLLPTVLGTTIRPYTLKYLTSELLKRDKGSLSIAELTALFWQEMNTIGCHSHLKSIPRSSKDISALDWISNEIKEAEAGGRSWQEVLFALYPLTPKLWPLLNPEDQQYFMTHWYSLFITYLAAFPLENAYQIKTLLTSKQLEIINGVQDITQERDRFIVQCAEGRLSTSWLINATGPGYNPKSLPFLKKMLASGLVLAHPLGGLKVEQSTLRVHQGSHQVFSRLYALGELTKGVNFLTTDLGCVTNQAKTVAHLLTQQLQEERSRETQAKNTVLFSDIK